MSLWKNSRYLAVKDLIIAVDSKNLETKTTLGIRMIDKNNSNLNKIHIVSVEEDLFGIALLYYGDARLWWKIADANITIVKDPYRLKVGSELLIP